MSDVEEPLLPHSQSQSPSQRHINYSTRPSLPSFSSSQRATTTYQQDIRSEQVNKNQKYSNWRNRRITKSSIIYLLLLITSILVYSRYLHRLIFIDYSAFPPLNGSAVIHPGIDPELSVPPFIINQTFITNQTNHSNHNLLIDHAIEELDRRFESIWIKPSTLICNPSNETQKLINNRFLNLKNGKPNGKYKIMIALNLHSSQSVLPALTNAILNTLRYIGIENLFLSIYENGSWDHTPEALGHLGAVLTGLGVGHQLRSAKEETSWKGVDRIKILSEYRNIALSAIDFADNYLNGLNELVFINDVFLCSQDILEVLWQRNFQNSDASCGTDWKESEKISERLGWNSHKNDPDSSSSSSSSSSLQEEENSKKVNKNKSVVFYDSWVARSLSGKTLRPRLDFLSDYRDGYSVIFDREESEIYKIRFKNKLPVPVYSCWNGIISLNPKPFLKPFNLKFRNSIKDINECPSSECQLLAKDFWSLGFNKWILLPQVAVTYEQDIYYSEPLVIGSNRDHQTYLPDISLNQKSFPFFLFPNQNQNHDNDHHHLDQYTNQKINWDEYEKPKTVVCWPDMHTFHLDFEWNHILESPYNPKLLNTSFF